MIAAVVALVLAGQPVPAGAPDAPPNPYLAEAIGHLRNLDEQLALDALAKARNQPNVPPEQLAQIHLYEGLAHAGLANGAEAVSSFHAARLLDPKLKLPADASPRVQEWWTQARPSPTVVAPQVSATGVTPAPAVDQVPAAAVSPPSSSGPSPARVVPAWVPWVLGSAAVVSVAAGAFVGSQALGHATEANDLSGIAAAQALRQQAEGEALAANLLYGGAVVLGAGAAVMWTVRF